MRELTGEGVGKVAGRRKAILPLLATAALLGQLGDIRCDEI